MARADRQPLFRARLFPTPEPWAAGPGLLVHTVRFVLPASIHLPQEGAYQLCAALLSPELPFSVVPFAFRNAVSEAR